MSNPCAASTCLNGNCSGCKNGVLYCEDPRCYPNCSNCNTPVPSNSNWMLVMIILILLGILLIMSFVIGYDLYWSKKKASEPKNLTVNKHVHSINPTPIVVSSPMVAPPVTSVVSSPIISSPLTSSLSTGNVNPSYNEKNLSMGGIPKSSFNSCSNM